MVDLHERNGGLVPVGRKGDTVHVLHLGGVGEHESSLIHGGEAVDLRATDAVVGGGCTMERGNISDHEILSPETIFVIYTPKNCSRYEEGREVRALTHVVRHLGANAERLKGDDLEELLNHKPSVSLQIYPSTAVCLPLVRN